MTLDDICDYLRVGPETALQCLVEVKNLKKEKIGVEKTFTILLKKNFWIRLYDEVFHIAS